MKKTRTRRGKSDNAVSLKSDAKDDVNSDAKGDLKRQAPPVAAEPLTMIDNTDKTPAKCSVCGDPCAPNSTEGLCWVCRRLKISAWRDSDPQLAAQE